MHRQSSTHHEPRRFGRRHAAALALAVVAAVATLPATALAGSWGPRTSSYSGIVRVSASGTLTRLSSGSRSYVSVCDGYNEGWAVYGYTDFLTITNASGSTGGVGHKYTPSTGGCTSATWTQGWATVFGYWTIAGGCAQVGWPVPDNCVTPASEVHRP